MTKNVSVPEGYKKTELGMIPKEWEVTKLEDCCNKITDGSHYSPKSIEKSDYKIATIANINNNKFDLKSCKNISKDEYEKLVKNGCKPDIGDVLFSKDGTVGLCLVHKQEANLVLLSSIAIIPPKKETLNSDFCAHMLKSDLILNEIIGRKTGTAIRRVVLKDLKTVKVPIPTFPEQQKIASILSKVDEQIEQTEQIIEKTELLKKGLMQKIFVYGTENQKLKEIDVKYSPKKWIIPENWTTKLFNEITFQITDGTHFTPNYIDKGVPFLRVTDIQSDSVDWNSVKYISKEEHEELIKRCKPEKGNILLSKNGTIGIPKIIDWDQEFSIFVSLCLIKVNTDIMGIRYLYHLLKSDLVRNQYALRAKTGTVTNLHLEEIRELIIPIPPLEEQVKISHIMDSFDTELKYENNYLTKLQELKKGLMQDLLTGTIRV